MKLEDLPDDTCPACGAALPDTRHHLRVFCNVRCRNAYFNGLLSEARAAARAGLTCQHCGGVFDGKRPDQLFCSKTCQGEARNARRKRAAGTWNCRASHLR